MKKLFISQPMRGKTNAEILAERQRALEIAEETLGEKLELIDSFFDRTPKAEDALYCLAKSLELLAGADVAFFAKGWETARGCKIENLCATEYGITVIESYRR